jgi:hypothetical protein
MELSDFAAEMNDRFQQVDERFKQVDQRFVDLKTEMNGRFTQVNNQFIELQQQIAGEGEKTRRHFDIAVEHMKAERNLALDATKATDERLVRTSASNAVEHAGFEAQLQDHENRLTKLEGQ